MILVTGADGFIGKHLIKKLEDEDIKYITFNGDITDTNCFGKYYDKEINHVVHLAGITVVPESWGNPSKYYSVNTSGTLNILEYCKSKKVSLTYISAYIYGIPDKLPITEETIPKPNNPYAHSKYLAEQLCEFYSNNYSIPVTILRPFNIYGQGQSENFVIPHIIKQVLYDNNINVKDLTPRRDYLYVSDVVDAIIASLSIDDMFSIYNIASGKSRSVKEIIDIAQNLAGTTKEVVCKNEARKNEINDIEVNISQTINKLKWSPKVDIEQGLLKMME